MAAKSPVVLILGAGSNIGKSVASLFSSKGYKVGLAARSLKEADSTDTQLNIPTDLSKPNDAINAYNKTKEKLGIPNVIVYNASSGTFSPADDPFSMSLAEFQKDNNVNIYSPFVVAKLAVRDWAGLPASAVRTFFYTGNVTNVRHLPKFFDMAVGKSGGEKMMWYAAEAYKAKGYKFYYVDERKPDGGPAFKISGDAHANLFWELAQAKEQGPWNQTFVKGDGYKKFE